MSILDGQRILILDEQASIAQLLAEMVQGFGCEVVGPASRVREALNLLAEQRVDAAIIDVKIKGRPSYAVAKDLLRRGTPWAFASGNNTDKYMSRFPGVPVISKPYSSEHIYRVLLDLLSLD
jgi:DNA-binding NarL/FixJ family response regulator